MRTRSWIAMIELSLLAGCGGGSSSSGPASFTEYAPSVASAACAYQARCGGIGKSETSTCSQSLLDSLALSSKSYSYDEAIKAGRLLFDKSAAASCLDGYGALGCDLHSLLGSPLSQTCGRIFKGAVAPGGACKGSLECAGGFCARQDGQHEVSLGCAGTCVAYVAIGGACDTMTKTCAPSTSFCNASSTCAALGAVGASCQSTTECSAQLDCNQGTCRSLLGSAKTGDACKSSVDCDAGLYCAGAGSSHTCQPQVAAGGACPDGTACAGGYTCVGSSFDPMSGMPTPGKCAAYADAGQACTPGKGSTGCPSDMTCDPTAKTCATKQAQAGAPCKGSSDCGSGGLIPGLVCDTASGKCVAHAGAGDPCSPQASGQCVGSTCDPMSKTCVHMCQ